MFLFFSHFVPYHLARLLGSTDFAPLYQQIAVRFLRLTFITIGTGSVVYAIRCLPKLRAKELLLEQCLEDRQSLEQLLVTRTKTDEQLKKQIADLQTDYRQDCHVYNQLEVEEQQLHDSIQTFFNDRQVRRSTKEKNSDDQRSIHSNLETSRSISGRHSHAAVLTLTAINPMPTLEARKVNITRLVPLRQERPSRSKSSFPHSIWSKKKNKSHSRGDGDTSSSAVVKSIKRL